MRALDPTTTACPFCGGELHLCQAEHSDGPGPRLHCKNASMHNFHVTAEVDA